LLEHATGMIGLPLRLLAREVYDRITARVGERSVALVTGEETRIPEAPRYFVATVEAMPIDREVDFVAIDEIQLMAHPQRGHVFTARLLGARGTRETWFLGSETARPLVERLLPVARIASYPRLSRLSGAGVANLRGLPPRSAVVAFSTPQVYELAARVRAARGGAAVVLGGMSPRTRNAQVALYQAGEVDYLVATDAIGMGLNLDVEHVAFRRHPQVRRAGGAAARGGRAGADRRARRPLPRRRQLRNARSAPGAPGGRRRRHRGAPVSAAPGGALPEHGARPELARRAESPRCSSGRPFRSEALDTARWIWPCSATSRLSRDPVARAHERARGLLWEACQIPDYGQSLVEHHARLVSRIFADLSGPRARWTPTGCSRAWRGSTTYEVMWTP
jgi:ATP-dependent RNA helicase SUPV3L1/SUV3